MWGCIPRSRFNNRKMTVPSLYVRVYRQLGAYAVLANGSLIICEGVSLKTMWLRHLMTFPHYMWGCIVLEEAGLLDNVVPSLYVRVYREIRQRYRLSYSSLIICEGVSEIAVPVRIFRLFPHYMWGCIASAQWSGRLCMVPSLYVRVYRILKINT